jgi:hypothetical protein
MSFEKMGNLGGRMVPTVLRMVPMDKPGEFTLVTYHEAAFDVGLEPGFLFLAHLAEVNSMSILRHAWRNLWRNGRRTAITLGAVCLSTCVLIMTYCLTDGLIQQAVSNATGLVVGEAQIHAPKYLKERSFYQSLQNPGAIRCQDRRRGHAGGPSVLWLWPGLHR